MSQQIDLERLVSFLKDRKKLKKSKKGKRKKVKKSLIQDDRQPETGTRSSLISKLGLKRNIEDDSSQVIKDDKYTKLKARAEGGYGTLIYALQKDVKDIQNKFMSGTTFQPAQTPFSRLKSQTQQIGGERFDSIIQAQRQAVEIKKNQDRIEKEAKAELKRIEKEAKEEVKRLEKEAKDEQQRARDEQKELEKRQAESERKEALRADREKAKEIKRLEKEAKDEQQGGLGKSGRTKQLPITGFTIAQGMRALTDYLPPVTQQDQPDLPFGRPRPEFDPNEQTPFYRSTKDRLETPVLRDILEGGGADSTFTSEDLGVQLPQGDAPVEETTMTQEEIPQGDMDSSMTDEALLGLSTGMVDEALLGGGGAQEADVAEPVVSPKRKGGRPTGSKNKPKPPPSDPSQVAIIGSSALVKRTPSSKTPVNTPVGSMI